MIDNIKVYSIVILRHRVVQGNVGCSPFMLHEEKKTILYDGALMMNRAILLCSQSDCYPSLLCKSWQEFNLLQLNRALSLLFCLLSPTINDVLFFINYILPIL